LIVMPCTLKDAQLHVAAFHRTHRAPRGGLFALCCVVPAESRVCGVAVVSRPVARLLGDGWTCEVTRCSTDGTPNACSLLYGAAWRAAKALGYRRIVTYTLDHEPGANLRGAGWVNVASTPGRDWDDCARRHGKQSTHQVLGGKFRWEARASDYDAARGLDVSWPVDMRATAQLGLEI